MRFARSFRLAAERDARLRAGSPGSPDAVTATVAERSAGGDGAVTSSRFRVAMST
jgi:hypothetical protein